MKKAENTRYNTSYIDYFFTNIKETEGFYKESESDHRAIYLKVKLREL